MAEFGPQVLTEEQILKGDIPDFNATPVWVEAWNEMNKKLSTATPEKKAEWLKDPANVEAFQKVSEQVAKHGPAFQTVTGPEVFGESYDPNKMHPDVSYTDRLMTKLSNPRPQDMVNKLEKKYPDLTFVHDNKNVYMKKHGAGEKWYPLDPQQGLLSADMPENLKDIGELAPEIAGQMAGQTLGGTGAMLLAAPFVANPLALSLIGMAGSGLGSMGAEYGLEKLSGTPVDPAKVATSGAVGLLNIPGVTTSINPTIAKQASKYSPLISDTLQNIGASAELKSGTAPEVINVMKPETKLNSAIETNLGINSLRPGNYKKIVGPELMQKYPEPGTQFMDVADEFGKKVTEVVNKRRKELQTSFDKVEAPVLNDPFDTSEILKKLQAQKEEYLFKKGSSPGQYNAEINNLNDAIDYFSNPVSFRNVRDLLATGEESNLAAKISGAITGEGAYESSVKKALNNKTGKYTRDLYSGIRKQMNAMAPGRQEVDNAFEKFVADSKSLGNIIQSGRVSDIDKSVAAGVLTGEGAGSQEARDSIRKLIDSMDVNDSGKRTMYRDLGRYKALGEKAAKDSPDIVQKVLGASAQIGGRGTAVGKTTATLKSIGDAGNFVARNIRTPGGVDYAGLSQLLGLGVNVSGQESIKNLAPTRFNQAISRDPEWVKNVTDAQKKALEMYINQGGN